MPVPAAAQTQSTMTMSELPVDVRRFVLTSIPSVPYLEALLLLRAEPQHAWTAGDLARRLKLACVACSVDTTAQMNFLRKNGWDQGQGKLFGEPASGLAFAAKWLTRSGKPQRLPLPGENA